MGKADGFLKAKVFFIIMMKGQARKECSQQFGNAGHMPEPRKDLNSGGRV